MILNSTSDISEGTVTWFDIPYLNMEEDQCGNLFTAGNGVDMSTNSIFEESFTNLIFF